MYGAIREYKLQPGKVDDILAKVRDEFAPMLSKMDGFVVYTFVQTGPDDIITTSLFESRAGAEASVSAAADWVRKNFSSAVIGTPRVTTGEMRIREAKDNVTAGYGILRRFKTKETDVDEAVDRVRSGLVPELKNMPGFVSYGLLQDDGHAGGGASLSAFADRETAHAANERSLEWIKANMMHFVLEPPEVFEGEIKLRHVRATAGSH